MAQSLVKNYIHIVFSTKHRYPFIDETIENELFNYLGGVCKNLECQPIIVGGHHDHVHILCLLSKKITLKNYWKKSNLIPRNGLKQKEKITKAFTGKMVMGHFLLIQKKLILLSNIFQLSMNIIAKRLFRKNSCNFWKNIK